MQIRAYVPFALVVGLALVLALGVYRAIHRVPADAKAFHPLWRCRWIGDAEVCERSRPHAVIPEAAQRLSGTQGPHAPPSPFPAHPGERRDPSGLAA